METTMYHLKMAMISHFSLTMKTSQLIRVGPCNYILHYLCVCVFVCGSPELSIGNSVDTFVTKYGH